MTMNRRRALGRSARGLALAGLGLGLAGCGGPALSSGADTLTLGGFSVIREAIRQGVLPDFLKLWRERSGRGVHFEESYNASGAQARAIASGFDADLAILSHVGDMDILKQAKLLDGPAVTTTRSLVVIGHRPGNPKGIRGFGDLAKPGVSVLYPDPKTSGGARWNINAIWGSCLLGTKGTEAEAAELLAGVQRNVLSMDSSGRGSVTTFEKGVGDAIITYENEILLQHRRAEERGFEPIPYVVPAPTLLIESPGALIKPSLERHGNRPLAEAFFAYLGSPEGQAGLAKFGFRPLGKPIPDTFSIEQLGGWKAVSDKLYGPKAGPPGVWSRIFLEGRA